MKEKKNQGAGRPEKDVPFIFRQYEKLARRGVVVPARFIVEWYAFVEGGDADPAAFSSLEEYKQAFPGEITFGKDHQTMTFTRPGTGMGSESWTLGRIEQEIGPDVLIVLYVEESPEYGAASAKAFLDEPGLPDFTDKILPDAGPGIFFSDTEAQKLAEQHPILSLSYAFGNGTDEIVVSATPVAAFKGPDNQPQVSKLDQTETDAIQKAWDSFLPDARTLRFAPKKEVFILVEN